jgi:hypothetical protein
MLHAGGIVEQRRSGGVEAFRLTCAMPIFVAMSVLVITGAFVLMLAHVGCYLGWHVVIQIAASWRQEP